MPDAIVYTQDTNLAFVADQAAQTDALLTFVIACAQASTTFHEFRQKLVDGVKEVKITQSINVEDYLDGQLGDGYVLVTNTMDENGNKESWGQPDYLRDDDGFPLIFERKDEAIMAVPRDHTIVRIIDLKERNAGKD